MTLKVYRPLNVAPSEYDETNESVYRRTVEQNLQDVSKDRTSDKTQ